VIQRERSRTEGQAMEGCEIVRNMLTILSLLTALSISTVAVISGTRVPVLSSEAGQEPQLQSHRFHAEALGRTGKKGALYVSFDRYRSEDGVIVERLIDSYKSSQEAATAFEALRKSASRVLRQANKESPGRGRVGPRAVLELRPSGKGPIQKVIAWTDGATVVRLQSTSLPHLEDFEKQIYPSVEPPRKSAAGPNQKP